MSINRNLGVDLYGLWVAAKDNYPTVAYQYSWALQFVDATERGLTYAFQRPDVFGGGTYGPVYQPWRDLRDSLAAALSETRTNLLGVADVLAMAVTTYRETDDDAGAAFRDAMKTRPEPQPTLEVPMPR